MAEYSDYREVRGEMESILEDVQSEFHHGECFYSREMLSTVQDKLDKVSNLVSHYVEVFEKEEKLGGTEPLTNPDNELGAVWEDMVYLFKNVDRDFHNSNDFKDESAVNTFIKELDELKRLTVKAHHLYHEVNRGGEQ